MYDGFISYSHAADDLLAPRLQAGLQRFAKPWWKRRALRVFRDESSLSANPHLWESIVEALDSSEWFVLLLSPEAAESEWVNREIEYWLSNREPSHVVPVVTDGFFAWRDGEVSGSAVPPALRGAFAGEPRWVDMRFAHSEEHLDLKNPAFADAVADVASALRGIPKDELSSEEVRQHRRTVRTAWAAGLALLAVSVVAVVFGIQSANNAAEAEFQRELAEEKAREAEASALLAVQNEQRALASEAEALHRAAIIESRRLTTRSVAALEDNPETAALLALYAISIAPDTERDDGMAALLSALREHRVIERIPVPEGAHLAALSPDGRVVYHWSGPNGSIRRIQTASGEIKWVTPLDGTARSVSIDPRGMLLAVSLDATGTAPARTEVIDVSTGERVRTPLLYGGCESIHRHEGGFSSGGDFFTVTVVDCEGGDTADRALLYNTDTWEVEYTHRTDGYTVEKLRLSEDGTRLARYHWEGAGPLGTVEVVTYPDLEQLVEFDRIWFFALSPDGDRLVHDPGQSWLGLVDVESGTALARSNLPGQGQTGLTLLWCCDPVRFAPDGRYFSVITDHGGDFVFDAEDGSIEVGLYELSDTLDHSWSANSQRLLTTHRDALLLWWITPDADRSAALVRSDDLVALAFEFLTRGFTEADCHIHNLDGRIHGYDECPSLDDFREALIGSG